MYDIKRIGKNIRSLRVAYGESQEKLGEAIGTGKSTISMYESGEREPSKGTLSDIAKHYLISVDELIYSDFSDMDKIISVDSYIILDNIEVILPIMSSEEARQNVHFRKAIKKHKELYMQLRNHGLDYLDEINISLKEYIKAYYEKAGPEAVANIIAISYLLMFFIKSAMILIEDRPVKPAVLRMLSEKDREVKEFMENPDPEFEKSAKKADGLMRELGSEDFLAELKYILKQSPRLSDLCDYYLGLQYCWNLVDNDLTASFNRRIGIEMLITFDSVGNAYAADFLDIFMDTTEEHGSQSVNDSD